MSAALTAARALARIGWPVLPVAPAGKLPLTAHGVKDASTDDVRIGQWWRKWPDANVAIATGAPGPTVLDVDDLAAAGELVPELERTGAPQVATPRGRHFYFAGQAGGTINVGYGELRGRGSYVVCPPSIHPSGREYTWLVEPNGPLPAAPAKVVGDRKGKGAGVREPRERVPKGERHDYLTDHAVRLVRSGITDVGAIERALWAEFEAVCDPLPKPTPWAFQKIAEWASSSDIANRERERKAEQEPPELEPAKGKSKAKRQLPYPPDRDAPLADLRAYVRRAMGLPDVIRVDEVVRHGPRVYDPLVIKLSNGARVVFDSQGDVTAPRMWRNVVQTATAGIAKPATLTGAELGDVLWALCVISTTTAEARVEDDLQELVNELVDMAEPVHGTLVEVEPRYLLLGALKERPLYDATDKGNASPPALVVDTRTGRHYLRSREAPIARMASPARHIARPVSGAYAHDRARAAARAGTRRARAPRADSLRIAARQGARVTITRLHAWVDLRAYGPIRALMRVRAREGATTTEPTCARVGLKPVQARRPVGRPPYVVQTQRKGQNVLACRDRGRRPANPGGRAAALLDASRRLPPRAPSYGRHSRAPRARLALAQPPAADARAARGGRAPTPLHDDPRRPPTR